MKRLIPLLLTIVLLCGCAAITTPTETTAPDYGDIPLPEFSQLQPNSLSYCDVTPEALQAYIDLLCAQGFQYVGDEYSKFLYRDDAIISIQDNTKSSETFGMEILPAKISGGDLTAEDVRQRLAEELIKPVFVMEKTPDDIFTQFGAQVFLALIPVKDENILSPKYIDVMYLAAEHGIRPFPAFEEHLCTDLDGDGRKELLTLSAGPTSGICTFDLSAWEYADGYLLTEGQLVLMPEQWEDFSLTEQNGKVFLCSGSDEAGNVKQYQISLSENEFSVEELALWSTLYTNLPTDKGLEVYVWQTDNDYACGLLSGTNRNKIPEEINTLTPVTLETMNHILKSYGIPSECITVDFVDRPATEDKFIKSVSEQERDEVLNRLFSR